MEARKFSLPQITPVTSGRSVEGIQSPIEVEEQWTPAEEKKLVRRIDYHILPMLCICFGLSLVDRINMAAAYIAGMVVDLKMGIGSRYNIAVMVFFVSYFFFELPSNIVVRRLGARKWLSTLVVCWGFMVLAMGFVDNWVALTVLRFFLGIFEAGLLPGAVYLIASWYKQFETASRFSIFYMASLLASGFVGIFSYALSLIRAGDGKFRQGWRWIFIVEGVVTVLAGFLAFFTLGDFPEKVRWLSDREKRIVRKRILLGRVDGEETKISFKQALRHLWDWKLGFFCFQYYICTSSAYSLGYFIPIILRLELKFSYAMSQILSSPPYLACIVGCIATAYISDHYKTRWPILCAQSIVGIIGLFVILYTKQPGVRYFGFFLAVLGIQSNVPATLVYAQNQIAHPVKRGVVAAAMVSFGAIGGISGSTLFRAQDAPRYLPGVWATIGLQIVYTIITYIMSAYLKRQNRLADEKKIPALEDVEEFRYAP